MKNPKIEIAGKAKFSEIAFTKFSIDHAPNGLRYLLAVGLDSIRTQKNIHARKLFEKADATRQSGARFVRRTAGTPTDLLDNEL